MACAGLFVNKPKNNTSPHDEGLKKKCKINPKCWWQRMKENNLENCTMWEWQTITKIKLQKLAISRKQRIAKIKLPKYFLSPHDKGLRKLNWHEIFYLHMMKNCKNKIWKCDYLHMAKDYKNKIAENILSPHAKGLEK